MGKCLRGGVNIYEAPIYILKIIKQLKEIQFFWGMSSLNFGGLYPPREDVKISLNTAGR